MVGLKPPSCKHFGHVTSRHTHEKKGEGSGVLQRGP